MQGGAEGWVRARPTGQGFGFSLGVLPTCRIAGVGHSDTYATFGIVIHRSVTWLRIGALRHVATAHA